MSAIRCPYCERPIPDGAGMSLVKLPYREPIPAHNSCADRIAGENACIKIVPKRNVGGRIVDRT